MGKVLPVKIYGYLPPPSISTPLPPFPIKSTFADRPLLVLGQLGVCSSTGLKHH